MASYGILIKPLFSEKVTRLMEKSNNLEYVFIVDKEANKIEIKKEIERVYRVTILSLRTAIIAPKRKTRFTKTGILAGKTKSVKKVYIRLQEGDSIEFFSNGN